MRNLTILIFLALSSNLVIAQGLIESRQTSFFTYIYKITDGEAKQVYKKDLWKADGKFFHTVVDSFPTDSVYRKILPKGHYLKAYTEKNRLRLEIASVQNFDIMILRNNTDLALHVYDLNGKIIQDAKVTRGFKNIRFDRKTEAYIDKKSNKKGLLTVTYDGFSAYYDLNRQYNNSQVKRTVRKFVYGSPVKYVWLPVRYVAMLPVDGVKSIADGYSRGTIQRTARFFVTSFYKIACLFDDYYCDYYSSGTSRNKYKGYIVFNKPEYMPHDTVKIKAYIVRKSGHPLNDDAEIVLQGIKKNVTLATVSPYAKGGFAFEFYLHDSLDLQLDQNYTVLLKSRNGREYISGMFKYEDYELRSIQLQLTADTTEHFHGKDAIVKVRGTDENDLNILDGRLQVLVRPGIIEKYFDNYVFIPDTLAFWNLDLEKETETKITIPDSIFPKANMAYDVSVTLLTTNNESITKKQSLSYNYFKSEINYELVNDSIKFFYRKNGLNYSVNAKVSGVDNFGNRTFLTFGVLPLKMELNPYYSDYFIDGDSVNTIVKMDAENSLLQCFSERSKDSIRVMVMNPRKLPFSYFIYKKNTEKDRGHTDSLNLNFSAKTMENYFLSVQYLWGGKLKDENFQIPYNDKKLRISVFEPKIVFPSQLSRIELLVTDQEGNPVPNADITAYSITKKFQYTPPALPYLDKQRKNKTIINNFSINDPLSVHDNEIVLDYNNWRLLAGLDSIEYYKFIYPGNEIYKYRYPADVTQFAPFVLSNGSIQPIHVIYVDSKPVYFSWSTNIQPYSFQADSGYHTVKLRTKLASYEIDSMFFQAGTKTILSIRDSIVNKHVSIIREEPRLSNFEKTVLYKYIFPYRYQFGEYYGYIEQNGKVFFLKPATGINNNLAGPVDPRTVNFQLLNSYSIKFVHEPFFEYEFAPGLLKMRDADTETRYPDYLNSYKANENMTDQVLNVGDINKSWNNYLESKRYSTARYSYPKNTSRGMGRMQISLETGSQKTDQKPLNILLFRYDDDKFLRIYPGNDLMYNDLAAGFYRLFLFLPGSEYSVIDSLYVAPDGLNVHTIKSPDKHIKDTFSVYVSKVIEDNIFNARAYPGTDDTETRKIHKAYQQNFSFNGTGNIIEGYVYDEGGNPIPGVSVVVKGTTFGTLTNIDGYYSLNVPVDRHELQFSFIGYAGKEVDVSGKDGINVYLEPDIMRLEEVVVVGYGIQRKSSVAGSVSIVTTTGIPGLESNLISGLQGKVAGVEISRSGEAVSIQVRGLGTTNFEAEPLYVIDGNIFTGNIKDLDPDLVRQIQILKDSQATAIYGARGANGVVLINTGGNFKAAQSFGVMGAEYDETFMEAASRSGSIRNNFSDYAFWQPKLITGENGKVSFNVRFPDDVTSWKTYYMAMNGQSQSGQTEGSIKSYKPLMAQLAVPRFLVENDSTTAIGKVLNYTSDTVSVSTKFEIENKVVSEKKLECIRSIIDSLEIVATFKDSVSVKYYLMKEDGYFDGEEKFIPVFPVGLEETAGQFYTLDADTALKISFEPISKNVTFYARADVLEVLEDEIGKVTGYKYSCNEQLASKLKALLSEQRICEFKDKEFKGKNQVEKIIRLLNRNKLGDELWGWWKSSTESSLWISLHVLEALTRAEEMGYNVALNKNQIAELLAWEITRETNVDYKLRALLILKALNAKVDYSAFVSRIEKTEKLNMNQLFQLIELKQISGINVGIDTLNSFKNETMFGNIYFTDNSISSGLLTNNIQNTLIAYRIIRRDTVNNNDRTLQKIRNYLFEKRSSGCWLNTFESSKIIETILPDLLISGTRVEKPKLILAGAIEKEIKEFPFEATLSSTDSLEIFKSGDFPVYLTVHQSFWNPAPVEKKSDFEISTEFEGFSNDILKAGKEVKLKVKIKVMKDADYVMVNVPIPAGCSYVSKSLKSRFEIYRESFKNETAIFCERLRKGDYEFIIELMPRYNGKYTLNPAKVELMYFPTFNANNNIGKVIIQ